MKVLAILALLLVLPGCAGFNAVNDKGKDVAAKAADAQMDTAVWALCNSASLGAFRRKFSDPAAREELLTWCDRLQANET